MSDLKGDDLEAAIILTEIEKHWPDWIEWYFSLDPKKRAQLQKRILADGGNFIKAGMWEYAEYAVFHDSQDQRARRIAQENAPHEDPAILISVAAQLAQQYGFDIKEKYYEYIPNKESS